MSDNRSMYRRAFDLIGRAWMSRGGRGDLTGHGGCTSSLFESAGDSGMMYGSSLPHDLMVLGGSRVDDLQAKARKTSEPSEPK